MNDGAWTTLMRLSKPTRRAKGFNTHFFHVKVSIMQSKLPYKDDEINMMTRVGWVIPIFAWIIDPNGEIGFHIMYVNIPLLIYS